MKIPTIYTSTPPFLTVLVAALFVATMLVTTVQTPTQALSLDVGKTITTITDRVPVVTTLIAPAQTLTLPIAPTLPVTPNPTPTQTPRPTTQAPVAQVAPSSQPAVTPTAAATPNQPASSFGNSQASNGLSVIAKQNQLLASAERVPSSGLTYTSNKIDADFANTLFILGIAGIFTGGCILFATSQRFATSPKIVTMKREIIR